MAVLGTNIRLMFTDSRIASFGGPLKYHNGRGTFEWKINTWSRVCSTRKLKFICCHVFLSLN